MEAEEEGEERANSQPRAVDVLLVDRVMASCRRRLTASGGFEIHPFQIGWYNDVVSKVFRLSHVDDETLAVLVLNTPKMFQAVFLPWLREKRDSFADSTEQFSNVVSDPLNTFMKETILDLVASLPEGLHHGVEVCHDFDVMANRRPKMVMTAAGHVSGAAYFYSPRTTVAPPQGITKSLGLSLHPRYGGWFAFRAVLLFKNVSGRSLVRRQPAKQLESDEQIDRALELFNCHWRDGRYRDVSEPEERYDELQYDYFSTPVPQRWDVLKRCLDEPKS